jgi:hypothetical protein
VRNPLVIDVTPYIPVTDGVVIRPLVVVDVIRGMGIVSITPALVLSQTYGSSKKND